MLRARVPPAAGRARPGDGATPFRSRSSCSFDADKRRTVLRSSASSLAVAASSGAAGAGEADGRARGEAAIPRAITKSMSSTSNGSELACVVEVSKQQKELMVRKENLSVGI